MGEEYLEREMDMPEGWQSNVIYQRDGRGVAIEITPPDDEEVIADAGDN